MDKEQENLIRGNHGSEQKSNAYGVTKNSIFSGLTIKVLVIGVIAFLLLIPMAMIQGLIHERQQTANSAVDEVQQKWSGEQLVFGPVLSVTYCEPSNSITQKLDRKNLQILPEELKIDGEVKTETLKRGPYEVVVYTTELELKGSFIIPEEAAGINNLDIEKSTINIGITDLRGILEQVSFTWNGVEPTMNSGCENCPILNNGISANVDIADLLLHKKVNFSSKIRMKGAKSLMFLPIGKTTEVSIVSNCATPSFVGAFLPNTREISDSGFNAVWKVLYMNRNFPQVIEGNSFNDALESTAFGMNLLLSVQHYQKAMRSAKYAILIIILTFVVCFFVEMIQKKNIHSLQYLLIGFALCVFYALLVSLSEHLSFALSFAIATVMTVALITYYMWRILKISKFAFTVGGLLLMLYVYIFVLIQMENYALLAGSFGLFIILAIIMHYSKDIEFK